ncbi:MAG TPA: hypothetical protein VE944_25045 [Nostoc sp.]|uniref:hypothetical protein n=1 Tax=Nostoc sp. TaxID=1180 RepID=UPI002D28FB1B|nr:hypothetical protein [Nostoc sp.]HYX17560.1 hypothetical protein [Nostoc sp.]
MKSTQTSPMFISLTKIEEANLSGGESIIIIGADGVGANGVGVDGVGANGVGANGVGVDGASLQIGASDRIGRAKSKRAKLENRLRRTVEKLERLRSRL